MSRDTGANTRQNQDMGGQGVGLGRGRGEGCRAEQKLEAGAAKRAGLTKY